MSATDKQVVVIGSGFAGSVVARRLVDAGISVTMLERGPWRDTLAVRRMGIKRRSPLPSGWHLLTYFLRRLNNAKLPFGGFTLNRKGVFELHVSPQLDILCSSNVGGGSHVYGGLNMRPAEGNYWDNHNRHISSKMMEEHYKYVLRQMASTTPQLRDNYPNTLAQRFAKNSCFVTDQRSLEMPMGFDLHPGMSDTEISSSGILGSRDGRKRTVDDTFLRCAIEKGLQISDLCEVTGIFSDGSQGENRYRIQYFNGQRKLQTIYSRHVVLAAGTINTLKLLFASREASNGLHGMPMLGKTFSANGDYAAYWRHPENSSDLSIGLPTRGRVLLRDPTQWTSDQPWPLIVEGGLPYSKQLPRFPFIRNAAKRGTILAGMGDDGMIGSVNYRNGQLQLRYDPDQAQVYEQIRRAFAVINSLTDSTIVDLPKLTTMHPLGGARLADSNQQGVINHRGEIFEHPGLYVADGAALPKALGVPPSTTIAAWGSQVASSIIEQLSASS